MILCVICGKEVSEELIQDFHDNCMENFINEMQELKISNSEEYENLKKDFYSKE